MRISKILNNLNVIQVVGDAKEKEINNLTIDSRDVTDHSLFVAIKGYNVDGHNFIQEALAKGAEAIVLENSEKLHDKYFLNSNCVKILVKDSRAALAEIANTFWDEPSKKITLIGITGSKGKTTTTYFIKNVLEAAGFKTGLIGTIQNLIDNRVLKAKLTTPESHQINELLNLMVKEEVTHCVMEVSSHSLQLHRVDKLDFDIGIFTNITSDHLDFHNTFENYLSAKKILFDNLKTKSYALINSDDENSNRIVENTSAKVISYGCSESSDFKISEINYSLKGTNFKIIQNKLDYNFSIDHIGRFNAYNAAAAFTTGALLKIDEQTLINGINSTPQIPGRFEVLQKEKKTVIVDYSHTADSLQKALDAIQTIVKGNNPIHTVFGCGGDRDTTKRPIMAEIASTMSDKVYITSDNPRTEDPYKIIEEILPGIKGLSFVVNENREEAIKSAIIDSEENAVILIAGKGHETYQEINGVRHHFSDKEIAEKYLELCQN
jgi:UDP-N-acetylmuramoyl-L-alanyl-D-glutamate--2,6-diaminopimelate ligase